LPLAVFLPTVVAGLSLSFPGLSPSMLGVLSQVSFAGLSGSLPLFRGTWKHKVSQ
jgi:hypothetical protein